MGERVTLQSVSLGEIEREGPEMSFVVEKLGSYSSISIFSITWAKHARHTLKERDRKSKTRTTTTGQNHKRAKVEEGRARP